MSIDIGTADAISTAAAAPPAKPNGPVATPGPNVVGTGGVAIDADDATDDCRYEAGSKIIPGSEGCEGESKTMPNSGCGCGKDGAIADGIGATSGTVAVAEGDC